MIEHVIKRDGRVVPYSGECIKRAISKAALSQNVAFKDVELQQFLSEIESKFTETTVSVEDIQDAVEEYLMSINQYRVARAYIVYREEHARMRALRQADDETRETRSQGPSRRSFSITNSEGKFEEFSVDTLRSFLLALPESQAPEVDIEDIIDEVAKGAFEGMTTKDIARSLVLAARSRIERDPAYDALAAALQLAIVYKEAISVNAYDTPDGDYRVSFRDCIQDGINAGRYTEKLLDFNIPKLTRALRPERDKLFKYLGVQTLYDRYLIHIEGRRIETPQFFWMRVAMGLAINEDNPTERAIEFYEVLSKLLFTSATPTLFNSGTNHPQLSSCYLTTVDDDLENIFDCIKDNAMLSKWAGGLGNDWTNVRATNAHIKGTNGTSQGVIPFLKVVNDTAIAVNQCFAGDTRVETPNGLVRIENIREGDLVLNGDGEYRKVLEAHEYEQHGDMTQLRFLAGGAINVTTGHPLWVLANTKDAVPGWVEAGGVAAGDYVGRPGEDPYKDVAEGEWVTDQVLYRNGYVYYKVDVARHIAPTELVYDLVMDGPENYVTEYVLAHNGGKRKGAVCAYLEPWHLDFEEFLDLRKNTGDDRRRTHDMHTAAWIPDLFMQRVEANGQWTLFSPDEVPELHDLYGKAFKAKYEEYERMADEGKMRQFRRVNAVDLWRKHLTRLFETAHPWVAWKCPSNIRSPQDHVGVVHSSNLCTEILLNTSKDETAVCNLGSLNLGRFIEDGDINADLLGDTIVTAVRMLDNVIDINYYPTPEARNSNLKHRPIGLGLMGFQDALHKMGISYASDEAVAFADEVMEGISSVAIFASAALAMERGTYPSYKGSKWDRGLFPIDTVKLVEEERGEPVLMGADQNEESLALWDNVRVLVAEYGMRNSNVMAIAPTATISTIVGASQSIEPTYKFIYAKSNLSGDFTQVDEHLVKHLKEKGLWTPEILDELKYHDGCLADMPSIPQETKDLFKTAFEIDPEWLIKAASARQKWIDQGQSLNLYLREPSGKKIDEMYRFAWRAGLKTTYYLRTQAATTVEKSTVDINKHGIQPKWMKSKSASDGIQVDRGAPKQCSLDNPDCEACQ